MGSGCIIAEHWSIHFLCAHLNHRIWFYSKNRFFYGQNTYLVSELSVLVQRKKVTLLKFKIIMPYTLLELWKFTWRVLSRRLKIIVVENMRNFRKKDWNLHAISEQIVYTIISIFLTHRIVGSTDRNRSMEPVLKKYLKVTQIRAPHYINKSVMRRLIFLALNVFLVFRFIYSLNIINNLKQVVNILNYFDILLNIKNLNFANFSDRLTKWLSFW